MASPAVISDLNAGQVHAGEPMAATTIEEMRKQLQAYRSVLDDMLPSHLVHLLADEKLQAQQGELERIQRSPQNLQYRQLLSPPTEEVSCSSLEKSGTLQKASKVEQLQQLRYSRYHESAVILFTDVKGFTPMSQQSEPADVMLMLDSLFGYFDDIVEKYSPLAYKVETIGDAYMIAFNLFHDGGHSPQTISDAALCALRVGSEMVKAAKKVKEANSTASVEIRVGIHLGPIMSGFVGKKGLRYCMFGDTVNTAARMESTGVPGQIHVSDAFKKACQQHELGEIVNFRSRGRHEIKGKGLMETFLVQPDELIQTEQPAFFDHTSCASLDSLGMSSISTFRVASLCIKDKKPSSLLSIDTSTFNKNEMTPVHFEHSLTASHQPELLQHTHSSRAPTLHYIGKSCLDAISTPDSNTSIARPNAGNITAQAYGIDLIGQLLTSGNGQREDVSGQIFARDDKVSLGLVRSARSPFTSCWRLSMPLLTTFLMLLVVLPLDERVPDGPYDGSWTAV